MKGEKLLAFLLHSKDFVLLTLKVKLSELPRVTGKSEAWCDSGVSHPETHVLRDQKWAALLRREGDGSSGLGA